MSKTRKLSSVVVFTRGSFSKGNPGRPPGGPPCLQDNLKGVRFGQWSLDTSMTGIASVAWVTRVISQVFTSIKKGVCLTVSSAEYVTKYSPGKKGFCDWVFCEGVLRQLQNSNLTWLAFFLRHTKAKVALRL